jgi:tellurite resistance protein
MENLTTTRVNNSKSVSKDVLVDKIKNNDPIRFDQMLIETEERKTYYYVNYAAIAFSREPKKINFPLFNEFKTDFERVIKMNGEIQILNNEQFLDKIISKGYSPETNNRYANENLVFGNLHLEMSHSKVDLKQPLYYIPNDTERHTCSTCSGNKYNQCPEHECHGQHVYDCSMCNTHGKIDCDDCNARGEYQCPSCHGRGKLSCAACGGSGSDRNSDYKFAKCKSCNGSGERKCSSLSGHGLLGAAVKKAAGNEYCGGSGIIRCSSCKASGKITCSKCTGQGRIECGTCYGDHQDNRYGKVDCPTCETAGELASISYIETHVQEINKELICTNGNEISVNGFGVGTIKKFVNSGGNSELTYKNLNGQNSSNYNEHTEFVSDKSLAQLGLSKSSYPQVVLEEIYTEGVPCATFNYNHILSATFHDVSVLSIDKENEILFHSNPADVSQEKESIGQKINEWIKQAFSTKSFKDKIDRKHEMFLMVHMAKADGIIEDEEKRYLSKTITGLHGFTVKEKAELFGLMSSTALPPIAPLNAYFSSKERAEEAKKKIIELVAKADGDYEQVEKDKIQEINTAIELGFKAKPTALSRFFKTWQVSVPIILSIISISVFLFWFVLIRPIGEAADLHKELLMETEKIELYLAGDSTAQSDILTATEAKERIQELMHESDLTFKDGNKEISYNAFWSTKKKVLLEKVELLIKEEEEALLSSMPEDENAETLPPFVAAEYESIVYASVPKVYFYSQPSLSTKKKSFFIEGQAATLLGTAGEFSKVIFTNNNKTTTAYVLSSDLIDDTPADTPDGEYYDNSDYDDQELDQEYQ